MTHSVTALFCLSAYNSSCYKHKIHRQNKPDKYVIIAFLTE